MKSEPTSSIARNDSDLNSTVADLDQIERADEQDELPIEGDERASAAACNSELETGFSLINEGREICLRGMKKLEEQNGEMKKTLIEKDVIISQLQVRQFFSLSPFIHGGIAPFSIKELCIVGVAEAH